MLPEDLRNKVIKKSIYDCVISLQIESHKDFLNVYNQRTPIFDYNQKVDRIEQLPNELLGNIDECVASVDLIYKNKIKEFEIPKTEEGLEAYKNNLDTLSKKKEEKNDTTLKFSACINKLKQYTANVDSNKVRKEKIHPGFFTVNKEISFDVERKSAVIKKVIAYLEGDAEKTFTREELSLINKGLTGKYIENYDIKLPEYQPSSDLGASN